MSGDCGLKTFSSWLGPHDIHGWIGHPVGLCDQRDNYCDDDTLYGVHEQDDQDIYVMINAYREELPFEIQGVGPRLGEDRRHQPA